MRDATIYLWVGRKRLGRKEMGRKCSRETLGGSVVMETKGRGASRRKKPLDVSNATDRVRRDSIGPFLAWELGELSKLF